MTQVMGQIGGRFAGFQCQFLHGARDMERPALVPEMPVMTASREERPNNTAGRE